MQGLQQAIVDRCKWQQVEVGLDVSELSYHPNGWDTPQRLVVLRQKVHRTLSTLHHQVLAVGARWDDNAKNIKHTFRLPVARKRRPWFEGLWANAGEPVRLTPLSSNA